jgi:hypothetical protein
MPGLKTETFGGGDTSWLGSTHGTENARTGTLDVSTFTKNTHYPDNYFPSGTKVNVTDEGAVKPWTNASGEVLGIVLFDTPTDGTTDKPTAILRHGIVKTALLPGTWATPAAGTVTAGFVFVGGAS